MDYGRYFGLLLVRRIYLSRYRVKVDDRLAKAEEMKSKT